MDQGRDTARLLAELTDKQREVLDLLVLHKTSKQIARELDISPHTVDQRITAARRKFEVETRNELAAAYMAALAADGSPATYESSVYQSSQVESRRETGDEDGGSSTVSVNRGAHAIHGEPPNGAQPVVYHRVVPESFEGRYGLFWRLTAIVGFTLGLLIATLLGLAIFGELSELLQ